MGLIEDYFEITKILKQNHGERSVVLMQNGAFYELYGMKQEGSIVGSNIVDITNHCDLHIADKKVTIQGCDVVQAGFGIREHILDKYLKKILDYGYVVSIWEQDEKASGTARRETGVYSSGTYFSNDNTQITNNLCCIWIQKHKTNIIIGVSNLNIYTGKTCMYEYVTDYNKNPTTYTDLERFLSIYNPAEVILVHNLEDSEITDAIQFMSLTTECVRRINMNDVSEESKQAINCQKQNYQTEILHRFFYENTLSLENEFMLYETATCSYCYLLNFVYYRNPNLIAKIGLPDFENNGSKLLLGNHSLKQLNIIDSNIGTNSGKNASVEKFLNRCLTPMGRRRFSTILLNPINDSKLLSIEYDILDLLCSEKVLLISFREKLQHIRDLEKINRKIILRKATPFDFYVIYENLNHISSIYESVASIPIMMNYFGHIDISLHITKVIRHIENTLDFDICKNVNSMEFDVNFIRRGVDVNHDGKVEDMIDSYDKLVCISTYLNDVLVSQEKSKTACIKIHQTDKTGYSLVLTKRRAAILKSILNNVTVPLSYYSNYTKTDKTFHFNCASLEYVEHTKSELSIMSVEIKTLCDLIQQSRYIMLRSLERVYTLFVESSINYSDQLDDICTFIGKCDVLYSKSHVACKFNYCRPVIDDSSDTSFINVEGIRHPLIENILQEELYVGNDVVLDDIQQGILLYGTNAVGKSSFIKSIGICVIMAQAGMFVPCKRMKYKPYTSMYTRILGNDNLFKGLSTFAVEMLELKNILRTCDENSIILGDELCSGTEIDSAISIFIAGVNHMYTKRSSFLFATHFHEIVDYEEVTAKERLAIKHMSVVYNQETDTLIYNRKLQDGPGNRMYGLEVCKSLHMPRDFLDDAHKIRNKYKNPLNNVLSWKATRYNSKKLVGVCEICNKEESSEVHHLQFQRDADDNGYVQGGHKNHVANLLSICESCHIKLHVNKQNQGQVRLKTSRGTIIENL